MEVAYKATHLYKLGDHKEQTARAHLKSYFFASFTYAWRKNKGPCFQRKVLGSFFFSPLTKGIFPKMEGSAEQRSKQRTCNSLCEDSHLGSEKANPLIATAQLLLQVLWPHGAGAWLSHGPGPGEDRLPCDMAQGKESPRISKLPAPISRSNYDCLLQKGDLTHRGFSRAISKGQQESGAWPLRKS